MSFLDVLIGAILILALLISMAALSRPRRRRTNRRTRDDDARPPPPRNTTAADSARSDSPRRTSPSLLLPIDRWDVIALTTLAVIAMSTPGPSSTIVVMAVCAAIVLAPLATLGMASRRSGPEPSVDRRRRP